MRPHKDPASASAFEASLGEEHGSAGMDFGVGTLRNGEDHMVWTCSKGPCQIGQANFVALSERRGDGRRYEYGRFSCCAPTDAEALWCEEGVAYEEAGGS